MYSSFYWHIADLYEELDSKRAFEFEIEAANLNSE